MKKKKKLERKRRGREIKRSIVKPSRRVLAFYCSAAGDGGSQQAAWWEASIKVSGRLIVIQSGGRLRYQFPVRPRSFPLRVFPLFAFFSLSLSRYFSPSLSLFVAPSFRAIGSCLDCSSIACPFFWTIFRDLFSRGRKRRRRTRRRSRRRRDRRRGETRGDVLGSLRRELCVRASACPPRVRGLRGSLAEKERWLAGWGTREIDSVVATTFHTDPVYLASSYEAGVGTRLGNRGRSRSRFPARLLARKLGGESDRIVFRGKTFFKGFFGREGEEIWVEDRENHVSRVILRSELLDDLREHVCEVSVRGVKGERSEGRVFVRIDFIWWSATFFFFGFAWNNWLTGWWPGGMVF